MWGQTIVNVTTSGTAHEVLDPAGVKIRAAQSDEAGPCCQKHIPDGDDIGPPVPMNCNPAKADEGCQPFYKGFGIIPDDGMFAVVQGSPAASKITASDGSVVVKLSDSEYSHLQALRQAVVDEEKRLAVKYGASMGSDPCGFWNSIVGSVNCDAPARAADHYTFTGQFLLIERAQ